MDSAFRLMSCLLSTRRIQEAATGWMCRELHLFPAALLSVIVGLASAEADGRIIQNQPGSGGAGAGAGPGITNLPRVDAVADGVVPGRLDGFMALWGVPSNLFPGPNQWDDFVEPSKGEPDQSGRDAADECPKSGNPVVLRTGTKVETELDFTGGGEMPLTLERTFNSAVMDRFNIFDTWYSNLDRQLVVYTDSNEARMRRPDGRYLVFKRGGDGVYREDGAQQGGQLKSVAGGKWIYLSPDLTTETYEGTKMVEIRNANGVRWTLSYGGPEGSQLQRVTHSNGRYIEFTWIQKNAQTGVDPRVIRVRDPQGNTIEYGYTQDVYGFLESVTYNGTPATTVKYHYMYKELGQAYGLPLLTGKSINGRRYSMFTYDDKNRATSTAHAGGVERFGFAYEPGANGESVTVETNPLGKVARYRFKDRRLIAIEGLPSANCAAGYSETHYDENGNTSLTSDFEGNLTRYQYDTHGHLLRREEASGTPIARVTTFEWDEQGNRVVAETLQGVLETRYAYDANNRLVSRSEKSLVAGHAQGEVQTTTFSYQLHPNGLVSRMVEDGPAAGSGDAVTSTYSELGDLVRIENSLGHAVVMGGYTGYGYPGYSIDVNGVRTDFVYDSRGRPSEVRLLLSSGVRTTHYEYDAFGKLASVTGPDGVRISHLYDLAGRLLSTSMPEPNGSFAETRYEYNAFSLPVTETVQRVFADPGRGTQP